MEKSTWLFRNIECSPSPPLWWEGTLFSCCSSLCPPVSLRASLLQEVVFYASSAYLLFWSIQQPSPLQLADGSALAESPESLQLVWTNEKEPKIQSLWPLKRYFHLWLALGYFTSGFSHWLGTACWQPGHPVVSRHLRRHAVRHSLLLGIQLRGR